MPRHASKSGSAAAASGNRTPPPGFEPPGNAQWWHNRSISAGSGGGGRSSASPAVAASVARPSDSRRISNAGDAAPTGWQKIFKDGGGSSKPYVPGAGSVQHQVMVIVARGCHAEGLHMLPHWCGTKFAALSAMLPLCAGGPSPFNQIWTYSKWATKTTSLSSTARCCRSCCSANSSMQECRVLDEQRMLVSQRCNQYSWLYANLWDVA